jgi:hypothetical protein
MPHLIGGAASFTDDTSLPRVPFVSIHAQVLAEECDLGWFETMRNMSSAAPGAEFKKAAIDCFFAQSFAVQLSLLHNIGSQARIHIVDPRPHILSLGTAMRKWLPRGQDLLRFSVKLEACNAHLERVRDIFLDGIAERVLHRSPAQYYLMTHRAREYASGTRLNPYLVPKDCGLNIQEPEPLSTNIEPLRKGHANIIGQAAKFVSASASVFTPATDELRGSDSPGQRWTASNILCDSHAFDEGNRPQLKRLEDQRDEVIGHTNPPFYMMRPNPLTEMKSDDSIHVQAADIAAGIARELWFRHNIVDVTRHFHYVTYNGVRLTVGDAISVQHVIEEEF